MHAIAALCAIVVGAVQFALPKGQVAHIWLGRVWVLLMVAVTLSSFLIFEIRLLGPFSHIHVLSVFTLGVLYKSIRAVRRGQISVHRKAMTWLYCLSLLLAGAFTLLPGRIMHQVLFGA